MINPGVKNRNLSECIRLATGGCESVLELGSGFGNRLHGVDAPVRIGVDAHGPFVAEARKRYPDMARCFIVADARDFVRGTVASGRRFDAILMVDFLEHLTAEDACALVGDCQRIAGRIVLWIPLGNHPQARDPEGMGADHWQTHRSTWEAADLEAMGFNVKVWPTMPNRPGIEPRAAFCVWECSTPR